LVGLELLKEAIAKAGYTDKVEIGMDVAASGTLRNSFLQDKYGHDM
jgi:enolase